MNLLLWGIVLIVLGILLGFADIVAFVGLAGILYWLGWLLVVVGIVLAIIHFFRGRSPDAPRRRDTL